MGPHGKILPSLFFCLGYVAYMLCFSFPVHFSVSADCTLHSSSFSFQGTSDISLPRWQPYLLGLPTLLVLTV